MKQDYNELYDHALRIAIRAHEGQKDKSGREYIMHPIRVAERCKDPRAKIVALLHDTIEDTDVTPDYLHSQGSQMRLLRACCLSLNEKGSRMRILSAVRL